MISRSKDYISKFVDSHCHIDLLYIRSGLHKTYCYNKFKEDHADSYPVNYEGCVAVFCDPKTFALKGADNLTFKMAATMNNVWLALGCHPKNTSRWTESHLQGLRSALQHPKIVALGEIGLDYSGKFIEEQESQKLVFQSQISLALEMKLPLVIHCRDADKDCLDILKKMVPEDWKIHRHCFTQDADTAREWMSAFSNLYVGFTPLITYKSKSVATIRQAAASIPLNRLLLETDAPFFVPCSVDRRPRLSHPGFALFTAEALAHIKNVSTDIILEACRQNTKDMYGV